jgi:hypothetical protein
MGFWTNRDQLYAALEESRKRKAEFKYHVRIYVPKADNGSKMDEERYRQILDTLYIIAKPLKGNSPQQDKWMITGRTTSRDTYRSFTVRFRNAKDATFFKLACGGR